MLALELALRALRPLQRLGDLGPGELRSLALLLQSGIHAFVKNGELGRPRTAQLDQNTLSRARMAYLSASLSSCAMDDTCSRRRITASLWVSGVRLTIESSSSTAGSSISRPIASTTRTTLLLRGVAEDAGRASFRGVDGTVAR